MAFTVDLEEISPSGDLYTSMSLTWIMTGVKLNDADVTNVLNTPTTFSYTMVDNHGAALAPPKTGNFSYDTTDERWEATMTLPTIAGRYHLHCSIIKTSDDAFLHRSIIVNART